MEGEGTDLTEPPGFLIDDSAAYRLISELTSDYVYSLIPSSEGGYELEAASEGFTTVTGYTLEEIRERGWITLMHPSNDQRKESGFVAAARGDTHAGEYQLVHKNGGSIWVKAFVRPVLDEEGKLVRIVGSAHDITAEKEARAAAERTEEQLIAAFQEAAIGMAILLPWGRLVQTNAELTEILGRPPEELVGKELCDFAVPEDRELVGSLGDRLTLDVVSKERVKVRFARPNGDEIVARVSVSLVRGPTADSDYLVAQIADVTEHHITLELLRERARLLTEAERLAHVGSWAWDMAEDRIRATDECYRMVGLDQTEAPMTIEDYVALVHPEDRDAAVQTATQAAASGERFELFVRIVRRNDLEPRTLQLRGQVEPGGGRRMFGAMWDVTDQLHAHSQLASEARRAGVVAAVARAANAWSVEGALDVALEAVCGYTGWDVGHVFLVDERGENALLSSDRWYQADDLDFAEFRRATEATTFIQAIGLPGQVLATKRPVSIPDLAAANTPRSEQAVGCGLHSGHAFPILSGDEVLAVLEFFSCTPSELEADHEDVLFMISMQLGRALERQRASEALAESEQRFRSLADSALDAIVSAGEDMKIWYANPATEQIFGYRPGELVGQSLTQIMPERFRAAYTEGFEDFVRTGSGRAMGNIFHQVGLRKDGSEFPIEIALSHHQTARGNAFTSLIRDISDRERASAELAKKREQLEEAQSMASMGSWEWDVVSGEITCSPQFRRILGFSAQEAVVLEAIIARIHPDDRGRLAGPIGAAVEAGERQFHAAFRIAPPGSEVRWIETVGRISFDEDGKPLRVTAADQDVTERKRAERLLAAQAAILQRVTAKEPLGEILRYIAKAVEDEAPGALCSILLVDEGTLRHGAAPSLPAAFNQAIDGIPAAVGVGSCGSAAARGVPVVSRAIAADPLWSDFAELAAQHGLAASWSCPIFSKGKEVIGTFALYYDRPHEPSPLHRAVVAVFSALASVAIERDRADLAAAKLEAQYRQSQKMEAVGQLAGGVAHDFNNLLQAILSAAHLLKESLAPEDPRRADLDVVLEASNRGSDLVRQLLSFARQEDLSPRPVDLNKCIERLMPLLRATAGESIDLVPELSSEPVIAVVDPRSLEQSVLNLVRNAAEATGRGGRVVIRTLADVSSIAGSDGDQVMLSVSDNGPGMDPEVAGRALEPFFTTKGPGEGSGLGLASVYGSVEAANGHLRIETSPGQGATFSIFLPATDELPDDDEAIDEDDAQASGHRPLSVLVAEDEEIVGEAIRRSLERKGYTVVLRANGVDALECGLSDTVSVDVVLTDVIMPKMSGPELVRRLRAAGRSFKALYMTGYSDNVLDRADLLAHGDGYISKPFTPGELTVAIDALASDAAISPGGV